MHSFAQGSYKRLTNMPDPQVVPTRRAHPAWIFVLAQARVRSTKPNSPRRCSNRLAVVPKPSYAESSPAELARRSQLLTRLRNVNTTSNSAQQPAQQSTEQLNAFALGFTQVDGVWTHPDYKQEVVQAVMDYLEEEW